jgi:hypothetical protein
MGSWRARLLIALVALLLFPCIQVVLGDERKECWQNDNLDQAIAACTLIIATKRADHETMVRAHYNRGNAHDEKGEYSMAIADLTEAIRLQPGYVLA